MTGSCGSAVWLSEERLRAGVMKSREDLGYLFWVLSIACQSHLSFFFFFSSRSIKKSPENVKVNLKKKSEQHAKGRNSKKVKVQKVQSVGQIESYMAVRLKDEDLRDSRQEAAKHFIHSCLYGSDSKRTTVNKFLSLNNKRSPVKKAAAQFLTSTWGAQKQQNAKRFKKRWMAKKMKKKTYKWIKVKWNEKPAFCMHSLRLLGAERVHFSKFSHW